MHRTSIALLTASLFAAPGLAQGAGPRVLFVRGGPGTGGFLEGGSDEQLSDIENHETFTGNHGWGQLADLLRDAGFQLEQVIEGPAEDNEPIDFASMELSNYDVIVLGSNNADYPAEAADAIEAWVYQGGGLLTISDANWGRDWGDAPSSDQTFLDRFGLIMNQDGGTYGLERDHGDFVVEGVDQGDHPTLLGLDGILGSEDDIWVFDGEGVSPITLGDPVPGVSAHVLAKAEGLIHRNNKYTSGGWRDADEGDGALTVAHAGSGRVAGHFDRNTFFNSNGAGTSLDRYENRRYALNLFSWLGRQRIERFCEAGTNSLGLNARIAATGAPSISENDMRLVVLDAVPQQFAYFFYGPQPNDLPFGDGVLCVSPGSQEIFRILPATQIGPDGRMIRTLDFQAPPPLGTAGRIEAGSTWFFQAWYRDPVAGGAGFNLTDGLRVEVCP